MVFEEQQLYGAEQPVMTITVSQYISAQLENDGLALMNTIYDTIYKYYFVFRDEELLSWNTPANQLAVGNLSTVEKETLLQDKIMKHFINHQDSKVAKMVLNITEEGYTVNVKEYLRSMIPERSVINRNVPHVVTIYKLKYIEYLYKQATDELKHITKETSPEEIKEKMEQLTVLSQVRTALVKELKRF